jgi:hypothetical protein
MLREIITMLPESLSDLSLGVAIGGAMLGLAFWMAGARFSRSLLTLIAVAIGTSVGMRLPRWLGWSIDGMAIGVGGAVILGVIAYLLHRTCAGLCLGLLLALWAVAGSWLVLTQTQTTLAISVDWKSGIVTACQSIWNQLPGTSAHTLAVAACAGLVVGAAMTIFLPRLSRVTTWSMAGITLILVMFAAAQQTTHSNWIASLKLSDAMQSMALFGLVTLGALIQWVILPRAQPSAGRKRQVSQVSIDE